MITIGIDDTDTLDTPGTNHLARALVRRLAGRCRCISIIRHQLFFDPRVPYTSKNGSASIRLKPLSPLSDDELLVELRAGMREWFVEGSDPGLCMTRHVPPAVTEFGRLCQRSLVDQEQARAVARRQQVHLEGLGGTEGGVIGALAAVGLVATGDDGRVVQIGRWPDDLSGPCDIALLHDRGVTVQEQSSGSPIAAGTIDVGEHLRPNLRQGRYVLFAERAAAGSSAPWKGVKHV